MSFEGLRNLLRSRSDNRSDESIIEKTQNFISSSIRKTLPTTSTTEEFDDYLASIPNTSRRIHKKTTANSISLRPELLDKCYQLVDKEYFSTEFQIDKAIFTKNKKHVRQKQAKISQQLDEVEVCLFNQITSRFDQILSVLRTFQSLEMIASDNQCKLKQIRNKNMAQMKKVASKHKRIVDLLRKKANLQKVLHKTQALRSYTKFITVEPDLLNQDTAKYYHQIEELKEKDQIYKKINVTKNYDNKIEKFQATLRQSFSDSLNQVILKYVCDMPYDPKYWNKFRHRLDIFEDRNESENSIILDDPLIADDHIKIRESRKQENQNTIIENIKRGWEEGQYSIQNLKSELDKKLKGVFQKYVQNFRDFCEQVCQKTHREVENPNLTNLLKEMSISFCSKTFAYFFDIHKTVLLRTVALWNKIQKFIFKQSTQQLSIEKKQKLAIMHEGFSQLVYYVIKAICEKSINMIEVKKIDESTDISDFKGLISVMESMQQFMELKIIPFLKTSCPEESFLYEDAQKRFQKLPLKIITDEKCNKLTNYLGKMHKNAIETELKEKLENEVWTPTDIPTFYYDSLHYLISGQSLNLRRNRSNLRSNGSVMYDTSVLMDSIIRQQSFFHEANKSLSNFRIIRQDIIINKKTYKVTQTVLLILEIVEDYMTLAQNFPVLKEDAGMKIHQIIRCYNSSSSQLIVGAGAVALQKIKSKNITSRHLALSSLCLSFLLYIISCIKQRIEIFECEKLENSINEHIDSILGILRQILLQKKINPSKNDINLLRTPSKGTETIVSSTKTLYDILTDYFDKETLIKIFTNGILDAYLDGIKGIKITSRIDAEALKDDVGFFFSQLAFLEGVLDRFVQCRIQAEQLIRGAFESL